MSGPGHKVQLCARGGKKQSAVSRKPILTLILPPALLGSISEPQFPVLSVFLPKMTRVLVSGMCPCSGVAVEIV